MGHDSCCLSVVVPKMIGEAVDRCMQIHGAAGLSDDLFLAEVYAGTRTLRLADGPDDVC